MMPGVAYARTTGARPGYTHRADVMIRLPALLLAGCVVSTGLILVGRGSTSSDSPLFGRSSPTTEIKTGAQAREIAEPLLGSTQRPPEAASSDNAGDPRLPDVRLTGIVTEPDQRIAIFAVNGTKSVVLSEGEALKDWRIDSISPQKVSLSGPAGTMTLKPKPDANLVRPAPPAAAPAGQPQRDVPPGFLHRSFQWFPAPAGAPEQPAAATLIAADLAPAPVQALGYSYIDCDNPYYGQYCQEHYDRYNEYYAPYSDYDYSFPNPVGFGFGFFHHHDFHHGGFHRGFHGGGFHGDFPGGRFHGGFRGGGFRGGGFRGGGFRGGGFHGGGFHGGGGGHGGHR
jgi:hypothetical protein